MKCAIVLGNGVKQIMFAPENDNEKQALKMITPDDDISIQTKQGSFYDDNAKVVGYNVGFCQGGYLSAFSEGDCVMLVLKRKEKEA